MVDEVAERRRKFLRESVQRARFGDGPGGFTHPAYRSGFLALGIWFLTFSGIFAWFIPAYVLPSPSRAEGAVPAIALIAIFLVMVAGPIWVFRQLIVGSRRWVDAASAELAAGAPETPPTEEYPAEYDFDRRAAQHAWYEGHSELNWTDRVYAQERGMTVDEYIENVRDRDNY